MNVGAVVRLLDNGPVRLHVAYAQELESSHRLGEALYLKISDGQRVDASLKSCMGALAEEYLSS